MKLLGKNLINGNLQVAEEGNKCEILAEVKIKLSFNFNFQPLQKTLFYRILNCIKQSSLTDNSLLDYEYYQDPQGIKIQVRRDKKHNFLLITDRGELLWAIYDDEVYWTTQFKPWLYCNDKEVEDNLKLFITSFINQ